MSVNWTLRHQAAARLWLISWRKPGQACCSNNYTDTRKLFSSQMSCQQHSGHKVLGKNAWALGSCRLEMNLSFNVCLLAQIQIIRKKLNRAMGSNDTNVCSMIYPVKFEINDRTYTYMIYPETQILCYHNSTTLIPSLTGFLRALLDSYASYECKYHRKRITYMFYVIIL